jgi:hypothetical protein
MKQGRAVVLSLLMVLVCSLFSAAQSVTMAANATVPPLIQFANIATDDGGNSLSGVVNITFSLYTGSSAYSAAGTTASKAVAQTTACTAPDPLVSTASERELLPDRD